MTEGALSLVAVTAAEGAAAGAVVWRERRQLYVTVIVKATFAFANEGDMERAAPQPLFEREVHHKKHPAHSIRFTLDLAPRLERADVLFTGHAYAPPGPPVRNLPVRLALLEGSGARPLLDKTLLVQHPDGFERISMVYERAVGGIGSAENPYGASPRDGSGTPNIVDPRDPRRPAGFAPIGRASPTRKRLLGSLPRAALDGAIAEIPDAFDWAYYQAAPPDQRLDSLRGDEWIVLEGLHSVLPVVRMRLPAAQGLARVHGLAPGGGEGRPLALSADTLRIDGEERSCSVVWRGSFPVGSEGALAALQVVASVATSGQQIRWPAPALRASVRPPPAAWTPGTVMAEPEPERAPLRGQAPARPAPPTTTAGTLLIEPEAPVRSPPAPLPPPPAPFGGTMAIAPEEEPRPDGPSLPFRQASVPSPLARPAPPRAPWQGPISSGTVMVAPEEDRAPERPLPFHAGAAAPPPAPLRTAFRHEPRSAEVPPPPPAAAVATPPPVAGVVATAPPAIRPEPPAYEVPAPPAPTFAAAPARSPAEPPPPTASPWAPERPEPAPPPPRRPPEPTGPPGPSAALKRGLYGKYGKG